LYADYFEAACADGVSNELEMKLSTLLREKKGSITERWIEETFASYKDDASRFFSREKNQFANPVGSALRIGTKAIYENLLDGLDADLVCGHLNEIIKIRAIQDFSPARAISFVFLLKKAIRAELTAVEFDVRLAQELTEIDASIDQIALFAFDIYVKCREQMYELRVNEVKRSVAALMKRYDNDDPAAESSDTLSDESYRCQGGDS
jgi:hypothetical protein